MNPCPLCQHVPYEDSEPVSDGWNTACGNCGTKLWDVSNAPVIVNRESAAKQRDIWSALAALCIPVAHADPVIADIYHEAKERAEECSEQAQDATYTDAKLAALLDELRGL